MAKVTWQGEDALHFTVNEETGEKEYTSGPSYTVWNGIKFEKGKPVDVTNPTAIAKAKNNPFFKVEGAPGRPPKVIDDGADKDAD